MRVCEEAIGALEQEIIEMVMRAVTCPSSCASARMLYNGHHARMRNTGCAIS